MQRSGEVSSSQIFPVDLKNVIGFALILWGLSKLAPYFDGIKKATFHGKGLI